MKISTALANVTRLGVETSPFIYLVEQHPAYISRVRTIFQQIETEKLQIITSIITLTEVLVLPIEVGNRRYQQEYREMLLNTESITALPVNAIVAEQAAQLRAIYRLRTPDALHVATALVSGCDAFLTNDIKLKRVVEIPVLVIDELDNI